MLNVWWELIEGQTHTDTGHDLPCRVQLLLRLLDLFALNAYFGLLLANVYRFSPKLVVLFAIEQVVLMMPAGGGRAAGWKWDDVKEKRMAAGDGEARMSRLATYSFSVVNGATRQTASPGTKETSTPNITRLGGTAPFISTYRALTKQIRPGNPATTTLWRKGIRSSSIAINVNDSQTPYVR